MFLAAVGINAGQPFVRTVAESGLTLLFIGAAVLLTTVLIVLLVGYYVMKIPYDDLVGVASGATGNPAILVYSHADGADRAARHRLRDDLSVDDDREGHRGSDRRALLMLGRRRLSAGRAHGMIDRRGVRRRRRRSASTPSAVRHGAARRSGRRARGPRWIRSRCSC